MRSWTSIDGSGVLKISRTKWTQGGATALDKVALLWLADPSRTLFDILMRVERLRMEDGPIGPRQLELRRQVESDRAAMVG